MAKHFEPTCEKHGAKRREPYDDHFIYVCDRCECDFKRKEYKAHRRLLKLQKLVRRLNDRIDRGKVSLEDMNQILKNAELKGSIRFIVDGIRNAN